MRQYLTKAQRDAYEEDRRTFQDQLSNPAVQEKAAVRRELRKVEQILSTQSPPELKGADLDKAVKAEKELREEIVPNMLSQEEMRKNPPGAVGRERAFQKRYKEKILAWKNLRRAIERDSDDPDLSNLEVYRPTVSQLNMQNAQIPGRDYNFPSERFQANYDQVKWNKSNPETTMTALPDSYEVTSTEDVVLVDPATDESQNLRDEMRGIKAENETLKSSAGPAKPIHKRGKMSAEQRKIQSERMKAYHARKRAEKAAKEVS
ncbi:hypothetical protein AMJ82_11230 [candidate division TA06 bacterium SM23_40]|uniref:Uncharacterized protein n=1 Tax=candidate division TA06 bacterium SM23_40 TaxID=1703774 RepID=A0A0S8G5G5_UNCT6|nr:MAG: hypothetical protein AMJ82_11230 [candidate division TA06 bacterium SM23_40]